MTATIADRIKIQSTVRRDLRRQILNCYESVDEFVAEAHPTRAADVIDFLNGHDTISVDELAQLLAALGMREVTWK